MTYGYPPPAGVVTGEAVSVEMRPAGLGSRTLAFLIDLVVQFALVFVLTIALAVVGVHADSDLADTLIFIAYLFPLVFYPVILETLWRGRTLGKAALGLRVVRDDGGPAPFTSIFFRELVGLLLEKPGISLGIVGVITMLSSERSRRVGDLFAGTMVVTERIPGRDSAPIVMPPPLAGWAATLDLSRLPDSLGLGIRQFLGRAGELDQAARERVGAQLVAQVAAVTSPPPPPGTPGWAYLSAIVAERRRREEWARRPPDGPAVAAPAPILGHYPVVSPQAPPPPPPPIGGFSTPA